MSAVNKGDPPVDGLLFGGAYALGRAARASTIAAAETQSTRGPVA